MKKLINAADDVVPDALRGLAPAHPDLALDQENRLVVRGDAPRPGKVGLVSGGGSGHEPLHGGFVGLGHARRGLLRRGVHLTGAGPDARGDQAVDGGAGVLHIVKNYTGDVLNFEMAAELPPPSGVEVDAVVIDDDVAVQDSLYTAGRRGVGVTVLVEKIAGAAAEEGRRWTRSPRWPQRSTRTAAAWAWR